MVKLTFMTQGRSTTIISMIQWIRTGSLSTKNSLSLSRVRSAAVAEVLRYKTSLITQRAGARNLERVFLEEGLGYTTGGIAVAIARPEPSAEAALVAPDFIGKEFRCKTFWQ